MQSSFFAFLILTRTLVSQSGDTLKFIKDAEVVDQWIMTTETRTNDVGELIVTVKKAKTTSDSQYFALHEESYTARLCGQQILFHRPIFVI